MCRVGKNQIMLSHTNVLDNFELSRAPLLIFLMPFPVESTVGVNNTCEKQATAASKS